MKVREGDILIEIDKEFNFHSLFAVLNNKFMKNFKILVSLDIRYDYSDGPLLLPLRTRRINNMIRGKHYIIALRWCE